MAIKEMQEGELAFGGYNPVHRCFIEAGSREERDATHSGFVVVGVGCWAGMPRMDNMILMRTADSRAKYEEGVDGWHVALTKAEALGLAMKLIELSRELED